MRDVHVSSRYPWEAARRLAQRILEEDGSVVLISKHPRAHRHLRAIYKSYRSPTGKPINPHIFINQSTNAWHVLLAPSDAFVELDEVGVPKT